MKTCDFRRFIKQVQEANQYSPVWWAGYLWLDLTEKQSDEMTRLLRVHPSVERCADSFRLPSGLELKRIK